MIKHSQKENRLVKWNEVDVDVVAECTGFTQLRYCKYTREELREVIISACLLMFDYGCSKSLKDAKKSVGFSSF
jgi:glyceraldehyde-3-phosphate dehydrogenase/erythrose-4-phosphate dehydrogenase